MGLTRRPTTFLRSRRLLAYYGWDCKSPKATPVLAALYFYSYTMLTSFVVLSLFVSVITCAMFEVMELKKFEEQRLLKLQKLKTSKVRFEEELADKNSGLRKAISTSLFDPDLSDLSLQEQTDRSEWGWREWMAYAAKRLVDSSQFEGAISAAIFLVAILEALSIDGVGNQRVIGRIDRAVLGIFTLEMLLKIIAEGETPLRYLKDPWNRFDAFIVILAWIDIWIKIPSIAVLRMLRMLRVVRLLNSFPALRTVTHSLLLACSNVLYLFFLIAFLNFIAAAVGMQLFQANDPRHFGSLRAAVMSIWMVETLENWCVRKKLGQPIDALFIRTFFLFSA